MARRQFLALTATRADVTSWHALAWKRPIAIRCCERMGLGTGTPWHETGAFGTRVTQLQWSELHC